MAGDDTNSSSHGPAADENVNSVEAALKSDVDSDNRNSNNAENSVAPPDSDREKSVEYSDELMDRGSKAVEECDYGEAVHCYKRALDIRLSHFSPHAHQCADAYNEYGCALLYEAGAVKTDFSFTTPDDVVDIPFKWKLLGIAQGIIEKHSGVTMKNVDILLALAEVARKEMKNEISVSYLVKALSVLEQLVEPDSLRLAELYYKICVSWRDFSKFHEAISFTEKCMSICDSRMESLMDEVENLYGGSEETSTASESRETTEPSSSTTTVNDDVDLEAEARKLNDMCDKLREMVRVTKTMSELLVIQNRWLYQLLTARIPDH